MGTTSLRPLLVVDDPKAHAIGVRAKRRRPAFVRKELPESPRWFCALPITSRTLMRKLLSEAGAHLYGEDGDVFYAGHGLLCIHSRDGGNRPVHLASGRTIAVELRAVATAIVDAHTGQVLMS